MIASVTLRGRTPGEQGPRDLDILLDSAGEEQSDWILVSIRQPAKTEPFATVRVKVKDLQRALGALFGYLPDRAERDMRDAEILDRAADGLNREVTEALAFQEEP